MKIVICGSMYFAKEMLETKKKLEENGHFCFVPSDINDCVKNPELSMDMEHCLRTNVQKECFDNIKESDAILVLNYERNGIKGYIGGATLMEIGIAQCLDKKIFLLYPPPKIEDQRYSLEIQLAKPIILIGAIIEKNGKILLVKETKEIAKNKWSHPAGWIELGENPIEAVKREVKEETGFRFTPTHILGVYSLFQKELKKKFNITPHPIKIVFIGNISNKKLGVLYKDVSENKWFSPEEICKMDKNTLRDLDIKKMIKDYFSGQRYPLKLLTHTASE